MRRPEGHCAYAFGVANVSAPSYKSLFIEVRSFSTTLATATGFLVNQDDQIFLITNRHVVTGKDNFTGEWLDKDNNVPPLSLTIFHHRRGDLHSWIEVPEDLYDDDGEPRWLEHSNRGGEVDVVALPLTDTSLIDVFAYLPWTGPLQPTLPFLDPMLAGNPIVIGVGDQVRVVGFPFSHRGWGGTGIWTTGTIATELELDWEDTPAFLVDARTRRGQSGSPVIFYSRGGNVILADGRVALASGVIEVFLGVYSGRVNAESDLGIVWKPGIVAEIITDGVRPPK